MKRLKIIVPMAIVLIFSLLTGCNIINKPALKTVSIYMWGGSDSINTYIDKWAAPRLKDEKGIILKRVPITSPKDIINKLITEKQVGKTDGSVDILWMNGENFKLAKKNNVLYGPFTSKLQSFQRYINQNSDDIKYDFGEGTNGYEAPWGKVQFVYIYDSAKVQTPPSSFGDLAEWVRKNPGKFTYPEASDFTGSAFIRQAFFENCGGYQQYLKPIELSSLETKTDPLWSYLNSLKPYLWQQGRTYPANLTKLDQLYSSGEVWMTMGYDEGRASNEINKGTFPSTTKTYVFDKGTLANTHFLSIPFNSKAKDAALSVIDFLLSPEAQIAKFDPKNWGDGFVLDINKLSVEDRNKIKAINRGKSTLPPDILESHKIPEVSGEYVNFLEKGWKENVAKN